jgi:peptidoglycan hydrolase CwlO-like protein
MPALIPTPDDLARLTPSQKAKVRRLIARLALELDEAAADVTDLAAAKRAQEQRAQGERIRAHARELQAQLPPDPPHVTAARRQALLDATR